VRNATQGSKDSLGLGDIRPFPEQLPVLAVALPLSSFLELLCRFNVLARGLRSH